MEMESDNSDFMDENEESGERPDENQEDDFVIDHGMGRPVQEGSNEKIENQPFDEAVELSDAGDEDEEVPTSDEDEELEQPMGMNFGQQGMP
jgi:hypothetical protein